MPQLKNKIAVVTGGSSGIGLVTANRDAGVAGKVSEMRKSTAHTADNHVRYVSLVTFFVLPVLSLNMIWRIVELKKGISIFSIIDGLVAATLLSLAVYARSFAMKMHNRIIRLEVETRLEKLLPADLRPRIREYTPNQLIALSFVGDDQLPLLAQQLLDGKPSQS